MRSAAATSLAGRTLHAVETADQLLAAITARRTRTVVVDRSAPDFESALTRVNALPMRSSMLLLLVTRDPLVDLPRGADIVVIDNVLGEALALATPAGRLHERPTLLDRLQSVSLLPGTLDQALEWAADHLAAGFGVDRCLISVREDSRGGAASGTRTWSSLAWNYTAERCRAAASCATPLVAPVPDNPRVPSETYVAVPLATSFGKDGFLGLVTARPRRFTAELYTALRATATRLANEVSWRAVHERATEELDRLSSGPGIDPMLGIWNQSGFKQLAGMQISLASRIGVPLTVAILDVVDLQGINNRYGLEVGDRVLRRIADAVRATTREEDLVARWTGDSIAIAMHGIGPDGGIRVAERLRAALAARPLELAGTESLAIPVSIGLATCEPREHIVQIAARAARAAAKAQADGEPFKRAATQPLTNPRLSGEIEILSEDMASMLGGTYRLLHEISRGGMGVVYRAQDRALERPVAIKMLRPDLAEDAELVERFRIEAAMLAHIQHPNLVQIYSFGHTGGDSYFVMELVEGESLEQAFERQQLERSSNLIADVPPVIEQIASALDALHERGIVHRDVKPANIIRDPFRNRSVLVDVGIARRYGQDTRSAGTPGFVAPEVLGGGQASPRSDVYGLAATAYTMLTQRRPWGEAELVTLLSRQCANELVPPSQIRAELAPVDELLMRALDADPEKRPASAGAFARELVALFANSMPKTIYPRRTPSTRIPALAKPGAETPKTRGVVLRSVARALGVRDYEKLRDAISGSEPELAAALTESAPLAWTHAELLARLFEVAPTKISRDRAQLAREIARATVRASFRRFFPASAATLVPERTLSAIRSIWGRYQSWGHISAMPMNPSEVVVRLTESLRDPSMCAWTSGMLEQLVILSGGKSATVAHDVCEATGGEACLFHVAWEKA